jgi:hypothetical protein
MDTRTAYATMLATFAAGVTALVATTSHPATRSIADVSPGPLPATARLTASQGPGARPADAPRPPVLLVREGDRSSAPIVVESARYAVTVSGIVARTRATLTFRNDADRVLRENWCFRCPRQR